MSRVIARAIAAISVSFLPIVCFAQPEQHKCFRVFDATAYSGKPDLASRGIEAANVFEPDRWWPKVAHDDLPDPEAAREWVHRIRAKRGLLVLDLERWWLRGNDAAVREGMRRYMAVFDWIRAAGYSDSMGYYGVIPTYNLAGAIQGEGSAERAAWHEENNLIQPLADRVDILFPSLYTTNGDIERWEKFAVADLREAKRVAHGKPVYPFLWPQYEGSNHILSLKYMPESQWARELEVVGNNTDGMVIWGGIAPAGSTGPPKWDESAPWWHATLEFLSRHELCAGPR